MSDDRERGFCANCECALRINDDHTTSHACRHGDAGHYHRPSYSISERQLRERRERAGAAS